MGEVDRIKPQRKSLWGESGKHVGLGSDFDGAIGAIFDTTELATLTEALLAERVSAAEIEKIMGGNVLRVLKVMRP